MSPFHCFLFYFESLYSSFIFCALRPVSVSPPFLLPRDRHLCLVVCPARDGSHLCSSALEYKSLSVPSVFGSCFIHIEAPTPSSCLLLMSALLGRFSFTHQRNVSSLISTLEDTFCLVLLLKQVALCFFCNPGPRDSGYVCGSAFLFRRFT